MNKIKYIYYIIFATFLVTLAIGQIINVYGGGLNEGEIKVMIVVSFFWAISVAVAIVGGLFYLSLLFLSDDRDSTFAKWLLHKLRLS